jgi:hypothetical protein
MPGAASACSKDRMMKPNALRIAALAASALTLLPMAAHAQWWQQHPAYVHAMSDLRQAYWLVEHRDSRDPVAKDEEHRAAGAIRAAYQNLKDASIVDGKDIVDQPPADMNFDERSGRLHRAMDLLHDAHNEVAREEDDPAARGFKQRALVQIDRAAAATDAAMHAWNY